MITKIKKIENTKLEVRKSDEKFHKTLQEWGTMKAQREKYSLSKIDTKAVMRMTGRNYDKSFRLTTKQHKTAYYNISKPDLHSKSPIDSDTSVSKDESKAKAMKKSGTQQEINRLPVITKKYAKKPKIIDFTNNVDEMHRDNGKSHFGLELDDKFVSISPVKSKQSKLREYYDSHLWAHMHDFRQDGKTKIDMIRRKYGQLLSPQTQAKRGPDSEIKLKDNIIEPPIIFAKRGYNDRFRYDQMKEINSLKDRLAKDGISMDTKILRRAILMPEDITN